MEPSKEVISQGNEPRKSYGIRVAVEDAVLSSRELGSFSEVDEKGNLFAVTVREELHSTSAPPIEAASYSFLREPRGKLERPKLWPVISNLAGTLFMALLISQIFGFELNLGDSIWFYYLGLSLVWSFAVSRDVRSKMEGYLLIAVGSKLKEIEASYGAQPTLDLPAGRLKETRERIQAELSSLPESEINGSKSSLGKSGLATAKQEKPSAEATTGEDINGR